jgi:hypothetical protein
MRLHQQSITFSPYALIIRKLGVSTILAATAVTPWPGSAEAPSLKCPAPQRP